LGETPCGFKSRRPHQQDIGSLKPHFPTGLLFEAATRAESCYGFFMAPSSKHAKRDSKTGRFVLGRSRFEKISAVEGIKLTPTMKKRLDEFDRRGLSAEERRRAIIGAHRKG
jgi:hypothetical protein